jgi:2,5-furandicarboxylate decarboxylase 1
MEKRIFTDFRDYLAYLEKNGKLLRVKREVDTRFDIAAGIRRISDTDGPALLFENIKGFSGWRVAGGIYATQKLMALAIGLPVDADEQRIVERYLECDEKRIRPKLVATGPIKEVVIKGEDVDLTRLPIPIYSPLDGGPYLSAGVEIAKHPDTGIQNASIHRRMILDKNRTTILAQGHHLGAMIKAAEDKGKSLGIATVIGVDPSLSIASQVKAPEGVDEAYIAGAFREAPLDVVQCETIDVQVPANAEIVIEGVTVPGTRAIDGPFGEFPGNYITMLGSPREETPVIKVTAITMRKNPIFQAVLTGMPMTENHFLKKWAIPAAAWRKASTIAAIEAINATPGGGAGYHLVVSIKKKDDSQPRNIISTLFSAFPVTRQVIVVDDDINVYDPVDVEWAIATRMQADKDVIVIPVAQNGHGKSSTASGLKLGIDATAPLKDKEWYAKITIPGIERVDYI